MVDLVHLSLDAIMFVVALFLSIYCFRLLSKFFKGGIFESSIKALLAAGLLFTTGTVFDIIAEAFDLPVNLHFFHISLDILAFVAIFYGVRQLYQAWTKLSH